MSLPEIWSVGITCQLVDLLPSLAAIGLLLAFIWSIAKITRIMLASTPIHHSLYLQRNELHAFNAGKHASFTAISVPAWLSLAPIILASDP